MNFRGQFFSGGYHPQDVRDEKVKKLDHENLSKVRKMFGCSNCIFYFPMPSKHYVSLELLAIGVDLHEMLASKTKH